MHYQIFIPGLLRALAHDAGLDSNTVTYVLHRFSNEGMAFLTVTLPQLSKAVIHSLECGAFQRPTSIAWKGRSLRFFRSLLDGIFDPSGLVRKDVSAECLRKLRHFCEYFYKLNLGFSESELVVAEAKYLKTEELLTSKTYDESFAEGTRKFLETNYKELFRVPVHEVFRQSRPRFGPGSYAGSTYGDPYWIAKCLPDAIFGTCSRSFRHWSGYFKPYPSSPTAINVVSDLNRCEVLFVPKDSRGPRVISKEPVHLLKAQLSFFDYISGELEKITKKRINFKDQGVNRKLALEASVSRDFCTLDLRDASDLHSFALAKKLYANSPAISYFLKHGRSTSALLPSGKVVTLRKLGGMGSGLTFPLMALTIHSGVSYWISKRYNLSPKVAMSLVYVYGDDIIVPNYMYNDACHALSNLGLAVNDSKSFTRSHFRESCGGDYYKGEVVSPVRLRLSNCKLPNVREISHHLTISSDIGVLQVERHCRELVLNGLDATADYLYFQLWKTLKGILPHIASTESPVLGRLVPGAVIDDTEIKAYVSIPVKDISQRVCPFKYLSKTLQRSVGSKLDYLDSASGSEPLGSVAKPRSVRLKVRSIFGVNRR